MNWNNHGLYRKNIWDDNDPLTWTWQLDHIIPHSVLPYKSMEDENFKKAWALSNLRPLSAKQNLLDDATKIRHYDKVHIENDAKLEVLEEQVEDEYFDEVDYDIVSNE